MSTSSSTSISANSAGGSLIDVSSIVSQLMSVEQQPLKFMAARVASYQAKLSAYSTVKGALASFQTAATGLGASGNFQSINATSSNTGVVTSTAAANATAGSYQVNVTSLAQAQELEAAGQVSQSASIGSGTSTTLTFDFGTITGNTLNSTTGKYGTTLSATTTNGSTTITAPTAGLAVGAAISGTGIPVGATIASITDANNFVISAPATADGTGVSLQAGATFASNGNGIKTVTIDSTNNSLQGIASAINNAGIGVNASIVNDGSGTPYRLVLTSNPGVANSMKISVSGDSAISSLLTQDPANSSGQSLAEVATAKNANFTVNGVAISSSSNINTGAINGVTLNLQATGASNIAVAQNTANVAPAIQNFVSAYNSLFSTLQSVSSYNSTAKTGAVLQGDFTIMSLQNEIHSVLNTPVAGASSSMNSLANVGVTFQKDGTLALDTTKLNTAISGNFSGIASLLSTIGTATDSLVSYTSATSSTVGGSYALNVSATATKGSSIGSVNLNSGPTTIAANTTISATLNGINATVGLIAGSYTANQLATMIQTAINGTSAFSGHTVTASIDGSGFLNLLSNFYGSSSNISISNASGNAGTDITTIMGTATNTSGTDVAGTIDGVTASGSGQNLTSPTGLKILVNGGATGARGTVSFSQGISSTLNTLATSMLATGGLLDSMTTGINSSITLIQNEETALNVRLTALQKSYTKQYTALDTSLSNMNSTSTYLTQELAAIAK